MSTENLTAENLAAENLVAENLDVEKTLAEQTATENSAGENSTDENSAYRQTALEKLPKTDCFNIAPLIKLTLLSFYTALMVPLPFLARATQAPIPPGLMWLAMALGYVALWGALSERVEVDEQGIAVVYPRWVRAFGRKGWSLEWTEITALKPRSTGQNGIVYYFLNKAQDRAYLLPVRVIGFARLVRYVEAKTDIDMRDIKPLAQPWMYLLLLVLTALLLLLDIWTITTAGRL